MAGGWLRNGAIAVMAAMFATQGNLAAAETGWPELTQIALPHQFGAITEIANSGDGSGRLYVVEQRGTIRVIEASGSLAPGFFLDIQEKLRDTSSEQGLLGLVFSPAFASDRTLYVNYTDNAGDTVVERYLAPSGLEADEGSGVPVLSLDQPASNHNGGHIAFGPDGWLYIAMGDGGGAGDPQNRAQNDLERLGKMLRYHPGTGVVETWAKGLRNPWKFSFDRQTGDLYIADVGQGDWEEVNFVPAGTAPGLNFGWRVMEGAHCYPAGSVCVTGGLVLPAMEYSHDEGCSVTGGYVARRAGSALDGIYVFSDYCSGTVWGMRRDAEGRWARGTLGKVAGLVTSFGEGEDGALYVAARHGAVGTVTRLQAAGQPIPDLPPLPFKRVLIGISADR